MAVFVGRSQGVGVYAEEELGMEETEKVGEDLDLETAQSDPRVLSWRIPLL